MPTASSGGVRSRRGAGLATALGATLLLLLARRMMSDDDGQMLVVAGVIYALVMATVLATLARHHPHARFGPANLVTTIRVVLTGLAAGVAFVTPRDALAWWVIAFTGAAALLDGVDGRLARRTRLQSRFGARFDTEIDALLILALSALVWRYGKAGAWVLACGGLRYAFIGSGWLWPWLAAPLTPTTRGKTVAVLVFLGLALALAPSTPRPTSTAIAAVTLATLAWSFAVDVRRLQRGS
jgi:phosphatidylglycerophosphate synthase